MKKRCLSLFMSLMALACLSGCVVVAAGALAGSGTYAYLYGWSEQAYNVDLPDAYDAALDACSALNLPLEDKARSLSDASIKAHDGDTAVWIKLKSVNPMVTKVSVRVGILGDEPASQRVLQTIANKL